MILIAKEEEGDAKEQGKLMNNINRVRYSFLNRLEKQLQAIS